MLRLHIQRHLMPALSLVTWLAASLAAGAAAPALGLGLGLFLLFWLVEATGIQGRFSGAVPRHAIVMGSRFIWLGALAFSVFDAERLRLSTLPGWPVRTAPAAIFLRANELHPARRPRTGPSSAVG